MNRKLTTAQIRAAARALHARGQLSGPRLREQLQRRFGARGAADRVYAIVRDVLDRPPRPYRTRADERGRSPTLAAAPRLTAIAADAPKDATPDMLAAERDAAVARAKLLEDRYEADTARWMREVDALRTRLASEGRALPLIYGRDPRDVVRDLEAALATAKRRIAELEARTPGEGPGTR